MNTRLSITVRHECSWPHHVLIQRGWRASRNLHMEFASKVAELGTSQNLPMLQLQTACCPNRGQAEHRGRWLWALPRQVGESFNIPAPQRCPPYTGPAAWSWMPQHCRRILGDCPGSQQSLPFLQLLKLLALHFPFSQGTFILLRSLMGRKTG